tara:strand:+ start:221 stop:421 length:201 start_codon:yes stop_codon:yes gene_type:complete
MGNCKQIKCGFLGTPFCPKCKGCGAEPNIVDEDCSDCWNCEHDKGILRGDINREQKEKEVIIIKAQ